MKATSKCNCATCKSRTLHELIHHVNFLTKYRTILRKTYRCKTCKTIKYVEKQTKNKNPQIYD